jgi:hypothetical protein
MLAAMRFSGSINDNNYQGSTSGTLVINKATAALTLANLSQTYDGTARSCSVTTTPGGLGTVTVTYNPTPPINVGSYAVSASLTNDNYTAANASDTLVIGKGTPAISWTPPSEIAYGTPLSSTQLNATALLNGNAVAGTFAYSPAAGTVPQDIGNYVLSTTFTPNDTANLNNANGTRSINVVTSNRSLSLDGSSGYLEAPSTSSLNVTGLAITLEAWVKLPVTNTGNY